ncbi:MAG: hypothetical protein GY809_17060 [Planctomycetes bacterium]|nr:hypothetical protein [Planctomycetota bacterium]
MTGGVSDITGREASKVSTESQHYCRNNIGGRALGKGGLKLETTDGAIGVYATFEELLRTTPPEEHPNKIVIYSPPRPCMVMSRKWCNAAVNVLKPCS